MGEVHLARHMFLWGMGAIYLFAFASLYVQIPGLYGREGILPARKQLSPQGKPEAQLMWERPTLLWLAPRLGLDVEQGMELACLLGAGLSLAAMVFEPMRDAFTFLCLWVLYLSLYQVGQVFLYFQWDNLLLETGFLTMLVAPLRLIKWRPATQRPHDGLTFWLLRWLLFRLMFASGVVKLTSRCPTWWTLSALNFHYESQCIPTPAAWFAHHLPGWVQQLSVVATYAIEVPVPVLFFCPLRRVRIFSFYAQVLLQLMIIVTGNYNFFNLLTLVLCLSLLDDRHASWLLRQRRPPAAAASQQLKGQQASPWFDRLAWLAELGVYGTLAFWAITYFNLKVDWERGVVESKIGFTYYDFMAWLKDAVPITMWIGGVSLAWEALAALYRCACQRGFFWKFWTTLQCAIFLLATAGMFTISLVPYTYLQQDAHAALWPGVRRAHSSLEHLHLTGSYGLFRRMTGVGGRPEVVIEGSHSMSGGWKELEFMYKPGNVSAAPPVVAPHQPRLDWQMWFAALGDQQHSPWFSSLLYRLLQGKPNVERLLQVDRSRYPFSDRPPTFLRAQLYKYSYTSPDKDGSMPGEWWRRELVSEFYPAVFLGDPTFDAVLRQHDFKDRGKPRQEPEGDSASPILQLLSGARALSEPHTGPTVVWSLFSAAVAAVALAALFRRVLAPRRHPAAAAGGGSVGGRARGGRDKPGTGGGHGAGDARKNGGGDSGAKQRGRADDGGSGGARGKAGGAAASSPNAGKGKSKKRD
ncbi:LOW QUALITY PROTEIN: lipase maturation factor 2 [Lampetra fluviatilis]